MIYLDNAATSLRRPKEVVEAVCEAMQTFGNSGRGAHGSTLDASREIYQVRCRAAEFFSCPSPQHVMFLSNATEALNTALLGLFSPGDHVITTDLEHNSVLRPLYALEKQGVEVSFCRADAAGEIDYKELEALRKENTKAVVCTHGSNLTGNVLDVERIGTFCRENNLLLVVDASQTAGSLPISMEKMKIDVLCFTGHKALMGPQGTGGLCLGKEIPIRPLKMGGTGVQTYLPEQPQEYPTHLEAGTLNGHGIAGLGAAFDYIQKTGLERIHAHEMALAEHFYEKVRKIPGITVYGNWNQTVRCPIVSLNFEEEESGRLADLLWEEYDIAVRAGAHCAPRMHRALGTQVQGAVRFSFGWFNTMEEAEFAADALERIVR